MTNISVCITTYNGEKYIKEQLDSILSQIGSIDEVVISDDSSTDQTIAIIKSYNDDRIRIFENKAFRNHIKNFEFSLSQAKGNYIFMADQDDIWMPDKVKESMAILKNANLVLTDCMLVDAKKNVIKESLFLISNCKTGLINNFYHNSYTGCCMAFDRSILQKALPFPANIKSHDNWIGLIGEVFGKVKFLNKPLILLRRHGENFSAKSGSDSFLTQKSNYSLGEILLQRLHLMYCLILRYIRIKLLR
jgi:glycosyltransferase involved in cell wall biosynthesis